MQSYTEVDKEDLYILKINFKGKRTAGKANKGVNVEKVIIGVKNEKLKLKNKKEENSPEMQEPKGEAGVYNNNKKCG